jgi:hypothetical protein
MRNRVLTKKTNKRKKTECQQRMSANGKRTNSAVGVSRSISQRKQTKERKLNVNKECQQMEKEQIQPLVCQGQRQGHVGPAQ